MTDNRYGSSLFRNSSLTWVNLTRPSPLSPGFVKTLRGGSESSPAGKPDPNAAAPARLEQQRQKEELAARRPGPVVDSSHSAPFETMILWHFETCKSVFVLGL